MQGHSRKPRGGRWGKGDHINPRQAGVAVLNPHVLAQNPASPKRHLRRPRLQNPVPVLVEGRHRRGLAPCKGEDRTGNGGNRGGRHGGRGQNHHDRRAGGPDSRARRQRQAGGETGQQLFREKVHVEQWRGGDPRLRRTGAAQGRPGGLCAAPPQRPVAGGAKGQGQDGRLFFGLLVLRSGDERVRKGRKEGDRAPVSVHPNPREQGQCHQGRVPEIRTGQEGGERKERGQPDQKNRPQG